MPDPSLCGADPLRTGDHIPDPNATEDHLPGPATTGDALAATPPSTASAPADLPAVPGYRVLSEIARGGMGRVLTAVDLSLDREVALKVLLPGAAARRFVRESKITARLPHPGIPPVHALGTLADGSPFLAMKLIAGRTLAAELKNADRARLQQAFEQVCQAVGFAHSRGIIHRDLKPANVMVGSFGEVQVMDWGLAKELHAAEPSSGSPSGLDGPQSGETLAGSIMGTPSYMSPEQARGEGERIGARSDVFALGGILSVILTGQPPFTGKSRQQVIGRAAAADLGETFARLDGCGADAELVRLCKQCLSPEPADRPADGQAVAVAMAGYRARVEERLRAAERERAAAAVKAAEQRKRRRVQLALGAAVVLLLLGGGAFAWWQDRQAAERRAEQARNGQQIEALLDRSEKAIADDDTAGAQLAVGEAEKRAESLGADHLKDRLARCRTAADALGDLDRIDALLWGIEEGKFQGNARAVQEWPGVFVKLGVVVGQTPPAQVAKAVNGSLARDRLLAALDLWLVFAPEPDRAGLARILAVADADPFRDSVRAAVQRSDWKAAGMLAAQDEALRQPARFAEALASIAEVPGNRRLAVLQAAARARPRDYGVLMSAGSLYRVNDSETAAERISWYRGAVIVRPTSAEAHMNLGVALSEKGELDEAIAEYRESLALDPKYAKTHNNLGNALRNKGELDGAIAAYRKAIELAPKLVVPHQNLGEVLFHKGDLDGAIAEFREAVRLDPESSTLHNNLGIVLSDKGDLDGAIAEFREAVRLDPKNTHHAEALRQAERWRDLLPRLANVGAGRGRAPAAAEACELGTLAAQPFQRHYAQAARLFSAALAADPKLADDLVAEYRYNAACCAALAGAGQGADTADLTPAERSALRGKALAWLRADLALHKKQAASADPAECKAAAARLSRRLQDTDLASTRPGTGREGWAEEEAADWDKLWSEVRATLAEANKPPPKPGPADR